jgi:hypothetical protein
MENQDEVLRELRSLHEKIDGLTTSIAELVGQKRNKAEKRKKDVKQLQLTPAEIERYQAQFKDLYNRWLENQETSVHEELERMSVEELRRFADANNLNVTAKTSKEKVVRLIGFRFREKKQLTHSVLRSSMPPKPPTNS